MYVLSHAERCDFWQSDGTNCRNQSILYVISLLTKGSLFTRGFLCASVNSMHP